MKNLIKYTICILFIIKNFQINAQQNNSNAQIKDNKPKLVIGIMVDQMGWEFLSKFKSVFAVDGGFNRLLNNGANCTNTHIPYLPTVTGCGHATVYTGSVPAFHGITGNIFWDYELQKKVNCTEDNNVHGVGSNSEKNGRMSPKNLWATTIADQLKLFYNFKNKTYGISIKERGAILPVGQSANGAFWYDNKTGNFISSTFYMNKLPNWLTAFNNQKKVDSFYKYQWKLSLPAKAYEIVFDSNFNKYVENPFDKNLPSIFPYSFERFIGKDYNKISSTPFSLNLLLELAKTLIKEEHLGKSDLTDLLAISFSATDYIGHSFGPNSIEVMDTYIKLDKVLGDLLDYLDKSIGINEYTLFLTSDHGVMPISTYLNDHRLKSDHINDNSIKIMIDKILDSANINKKVVTTVLESHIYFNDSIMNHLDRNYIVRIIKQFLIRKNDNILMVIDNTNIGGQFINQNLSNLVANSYNPKRSGDLLIILKPFVINSEYPKGTSHGSWYNYDSHIPLIFYGNGVKPGKITRATYMTDIAPTISQLLEIQEPNASIGNTIQEVLK